MAYLGEYALPRFAFPLVLFGDPIAPQKAQQLYFIELIGCNVNLGNIAPSEVIAMEAMRVGLRGDTFHMFLDKAQM